MRRKRVLYEETVVSGQPMGLLSGKQILVVGAGGGIGQCIAVSVQRAGASVILAARDLEKLRNIPELGQSACCVRCDVSMEVSIRKMFDCLSGIVPDLVVNCTGYRSAHDAENDFLNVSEEDWDTAFTVNYKGNEMLATAYRERLRIVGKRGGILIISSIDGIKAAATPYGISKSFLNSWIGTVTASEDDLKVLGIAPGPTATRMMKKDLKFNYYRKDHPLRRCAVPQDIANMSVFMLSSISYLENGSILVCDGGMTL